MLPEPTESIITLMGYYHSDNTFHTLNGEVYDVITYRNFNRELKDDTLCCVNIRWSDKLNQWVIFQAVLI